MVNTGLVNTGLVNTRLVNTGLVYSRPGTGRAGRNRFKPPGLSMGGRCVAGLGGSTGLGGTRRLSDMEADGDDAPEADVEIPAAVGDGLTSSVSSSEAQPTTFASKIRNVRAMGIAYGSDFQGLRLDLSMGTLLELDLMALN